MQISQYPRNADGTPMDIEVGVLTDSTGNNGQRLLTQVTGPDGAPIDTKALVFLDPSGNVMSSMAYSTTRAELAANTNPVNNAIRFVQEDGYEAFYRYQTGDFSAEVADFSNIENQRYIAPTSAPTGASGAWVRTQDPLPQRNKDAIVIVAAGQSNSLGANNGGRNPTNKKVFTWDAIAGAFVAGGRYDQLPWTRAAPDGNGGNNNFALAAAHRIQEQTGRKVYVILDATGGTSIQNWIGAGIASVRYAALRTKVAAALAAIGLTHIDMFIWSQGEEDSLLASFATHVTSLGTLNAQLRAETWMQQFTPVFVTAMSDLHDRYETQPALRYYCSRVGPSWRYINMKGLPTADGTHYTGASLWEGGYYHIAPAFLSEHMGELQDLVPFYNRGNGRLTQSDPTAITTFSNMVSWDSRTDGFGVTDTYTGNGATTAYTLTSRGTISSVTVAGVAKVSPADYSVAGQTLTFTVAPANGAAIVVTYGAAINGPAATGSITWGFRCVADGNYTSAIGYLNVVGNLASYAHAFGRENVINDGADYGFVTGFQNTLSGTGLYQFAAGRGHNLVATGEVGLGMFPFSTTGVYSCQFGSGSSSAARRTSYGVNAAQGNFYLLAPSLAVDPQQREEVTFKRISNTSLQILMKGTDDVVRNVALPLGSGATFATTGVNTFSGQQTFDQGNQTNVPELNVTNIGAGTSAARFSLQAGGTYDFATTNGNRWFSQSLNRTMRNNVNGAAFDAATEAFTFENEGADTRRVMNLTQVSGTATGDFLQADVNGTVKMKITNDGGILSRGQAGVGYYTGAGGTVTQITSKTTGVTLNKITGRFTTMNDNLAAGARATFRVTNSSVASSDVIILNLQSGQAATGTYRYWIEKVSAGSFDVTIENLSGGGLAEALLFNFCVIKGTLA